MQYPEMEQRQLPILEDHGEEGGEYKGTAPESSDGESTVYIEINAEYAINVERGIG